MISERISFDSIPKTQSYKKMINGLKDDRFSISDVEEYLQSEDVTLYKLTVEGEYIGFYSVEAGHVSEAHAYILPEFRKHSISALRFIARETPKPFLTSVHGTHMHVYKLLKRMGFKDYYSVPSAVCKGGEKYDVHYLFKKE